LDLRYLLSLGIGSGSPFALAAARALLDSPNLTVEEIAKKAMDIASDLCIYTNKNFVMEILEPSTEQ
jgi:ATP-dependent HslUV protease subunit HslV